MNRLINQTEPTKEQVLSAGSPSFEPSRENQYLARVNHAGAQFALEAERRRIAEKNGQAEYVPMREGEFLSGLKAPEQEAREPEKTLPQKAWSVYKDMWQGTAELPRAMVNGLSKAVTEAADLAYQAGSLYLRIPDAVFGTRLEKDKETYFDEIPSLQPFEDPKSTTGKLAQSAIAFLAGFAGAGKVTQGLKGLKLAAKMPRAFRTTKSLLDGALASAAVFDGHEERLSNLVESNPKLSNPVTRFLMAREDDSEMEGKMKAAMEDAGFGVLAEGILSGLKAVRKARIAKQSLETTDLAKTLAQVEEKTALQDAQSLKKNFEKLGNLDDADLLTKRSEDGDALGKAGGEAVAQTHIKRASVGLSIQIPENSPIVSKLTGAEVAAPGTELKILRKKTKEYFKNHFAGKSVVCPGVGKIDLYQSGMNEIASNQSNAGKLSMVPALRDILEKGQKVGENVLETPKKNGIFKFYYVQAKVEIQGQVRFAQVDIGETVDGKRLYFLNDITAGTKKPEAGIHLQKAGPASDINSIAHGADFVNTPSIKTYINFARMDTADDVKKVLQDMAEREKPVIDAARRGKQTFEEIKLNADQQDAWDILASRRQGEPLNAEQSVAARRLWVSSGEKLTETAQLAATEPTEANLFMFRKMANIHALVQKEVIAARTETARALASWRIPAGGSQMLEKEMQDALSSTGGTETAREFARRIALLAKSGNLRAVEAVVEKGSKATTLDALQEAFISGLLTNPPTHIVNVASNSLVQVWNVLDRAVAERISAWMGDGAGVAAGEAAAKMRGMVDGFTDSLRLAWKNFKTGESAFGADKLVVRKNAVSAETWNISQGSMFGSAVDVAGNWVVGLPFRLLSGADEFFKGVGWRGEIKAQAVRQAHSEVADGLIVQADVARRIAELTDNPPEHIRLAAMGEAEYATFTNAPNEFAKNIGALARKVPGLKFFVPFIKTPSNVFDYAFAHSPFAPLTRKFRADILAGGARQSMALAKMATGSLAMAVVADMTMSGLISGGGPDNPAERKALMATGWQPYSVNIGGKWHSYRRADPLGTVVGFGADLTEIMQKVQDEEEDKDLTDVVKMGVLSVANNILSTNFLMGFANLVEALSDPQRYGNSYIDQLGLSFVPTGVKAVRRLNDPYMREAGTMLQKFKNTLPGLSKDLPLRRDLFGRPISYASGYGIVYDALVPVRVNGKQSEPVDEEILKQQVYVDMPNYKVSFDGEIMNLRKRPEVYSRYVELAGNELKLPQYDSKGCKDFLNDVVTGESALSDIYELYTEGPTGGKADFLRKVMWQYRDAARKKLLEEFPDIAEELSLRAGQKTGKIKI